MDQICRFPWLSSLVCEYEVTGNEIYAKHVIGGMTQRGLLENAVSGSWQDTPWSAQGSHSVDVCEHFL